MKNVCLSFCIHLIFLLFTDNINASSIATTGIMVMSATASLKELTDKKGSILGNLFNSDDEIALEEVMFSIKEDMNNRGAVRIHIVIVYEKELAIELSKMSADQYFYTVSQLIKDHPDNMKIFEWELVAKRRIIPWTEIQYPSSHMKPLVAFIFANYSGTGEYRAKIPSTYRKVKITLEQNNFRIDYDDKDD